MDSNEIMPLSLVANSLRELRDEIGHGYESRRLYGDPTLYGDLQYIYSKTLSARDKRYGEDHTINENRLDVSRKTERPDLVEGELEYAIARAEESLDKLKDIDEDPYDLEWHINDALETLRKHYIEAQNGNILKI